METELIVFVTPLYYFGMSAQIKVVIDRFHASNAKIAGNKKAMLLAAAYGADDWTMEGLEKTYESMLRFLAWEDAGKLMATSCPAREVLEQTDYPQITIFLYGHSMGGNIAIGYMIDRRPKVKGLIITGAAIKTPKDMPSFIVNALLSSPPLIQNIVIPNGLNLKSLCSDKKIIEEYKKDPLVHTKVSLAAGATILKNAQTILSYKLENDYPVLLMHGAKDTICYPKGTELLSREVFMNKVTIKIWGNMYHEIHNETDKKQVWDFMMDWMNKNVQ